MSLASERNRDGLAPLTVVIEESRPRLRPIVMTSIALVAGAVPLEDQHLQLPWGHPQGGGVTARAK